MQEINNQKTNDISQEDSRRHIKSRHRNNITYVLIIIILWFGILGGSGYYVKQYFDKSIQTVQQTNAMNVKDLEDRLNSLSTEMQEIKEALQNTDQTISDSGTSQKELNNKIELLDKQLKGLEKSLNILKEAPNESR